MLKPEALSLDFSGTCALGPGKINLLEGIERTGSLSSRRARAGISYRRGWLLVRSTMKVSMARGRLSVRQRQSGAQLKRFRTPGLSPITGDFEAAVDALATKTFAGVQASGKVAEIPVRAAGDLGPGYRRPKTPH